MVRTGLMRESRIFLSGGGGFDAYLILQRWGGEFGTRQSDPHLDSLMVPLLVLLVLQITDVRQSIEILFF